MKNEGWTWSELAGELMERGIDPDSVSADQVNSALDYPRCEDAARKIERQGQEDD